MVLPHTRREGYNEALTNKDVTSLDWNRYDIIIM